MGAFVRHRSSRMSQPRAQLLGQHFQYHGSNIVMRHALTGERQQAIEKEVYRFGCRFVSALRPDLLHLCSAELDSLPVTGVMEAVSREENAVSRRELHDMPFVSGPGEHSRGQSTPT
jgi:hypothetical protein